MFAGSIKLKDFKIMKKEPIKGYKVTDENMQCLSFKYELGKKFKHNRAISICNYGFHYCPVLADCFGYYTFASTNRVFEILDHGTPFNKGDKSCTDEIEFIKELTWLEVLTIVNIGKDNTGLKNTGNWNTGDRNTGYRNTGAFCTDNDPKMILFNKETTITVREWERSKAFDIMASYLHINIWIPDYKMTDAEKESYHLIKLLKVF
jgi:hypothetical protein